MSRRTRQAVAIPAKVKTYLRLGVLCIILTAAIGNVGHTFTHVDRSGQHGLYAAAMSVVPDVGVLIGVTLLTYRRRSFWGWTIIVASAAFVSWSAFSVSGAAWSSRIVALAPVAFAAIGAGLLESIRGESAELVLAHAEALAEDAERAAWAAAGRAASDIGRAVDDARSATGRVAELEEQLAAERAAVVALQDIQRDIPTGIEPAAKGSAAPPARVARKAKPQVTPDVPSGLTDSAVTVYSYLLGRGDVRREVMLKDIGMSESTLKVALRQLAEKGHVLPVARGIYRSVDPDLEGAADGQSTGSGRVSAMSVDGQSVPEL